jgi:hypothetical protein
MSSSSSSSATAEANRIGPNPAILDQLLPASDRKRSRPASSSSSSSSSSLDYKVTSEENLVTPPRNPPPPKKQQYDDQWQQQGTEQRPRIATRARGSSGIPPRSKLDLEDLQGMPEADVMRALYEDPELAAEAAAQMEEDTIAAERGRNKSSKTNRKKNPLPGKREDLLKDQGFPFVQWIIIVLLLGAGLYQIYKSLSKSTKAPAKVKGSSASTKTSKPKQKANKSKPVVNNRSVVAKKQPVVVEEQEPVEKEPQESTDARKQEKQGTKKKPRKAKVAKKKPDEQAPTTTPEPEALTIPQHIVLGQEDDQGEWQTVGTTLTSKTATDPQVVTPTDTTPKTATKGDVVASTSKPKKKNKTVERAPEVIPVKTVPKEEETEAGDTIAKEELSQITTQEEATETATLEKAKPEELKMNGTNGSSDDENGDTLSTEGDAAMALELQQQEERAAKASQQQEDRIAKQEEGGEEDAQVNWAQVKKTKKRRPKNES